MKPQDSDILLLCHDDQIVLRGQKNEVGLDTKWRAHMRKTGPVLMYYNPDTHELKAPIGPLPPGFLKVQGRERELEKDIFVYAAFAYIRF